MLDGTRPGPHNRSTSQLCSRLLVLRPTSRNRTMQRNRQLFPAVAVLTTLFLIACDDTPTSPELTSQPGRPLLEISDGAHDEAVATPWN